MVRARHVFLEAFVVALLLFSFGILVGIFIENTRVARLDKNFAQLENDILDARLLSDLIATSDCELAASENIKFADRVFFESKLLDKYEQSNEITDAIRQQHMKYDLLRAMIWMNSVSIKERCDSDYYNVVYLYKYENPTLSDRAKQSVVSNLLSDLKNEKGDKVLLVSIAGDIGLPSIELLKNHYNITELPVILINEEIKLTEITGRGQLDRIIV